MIKALRKKYIAVTMIYICIVFAILYAANSIYSNYCFDMDSLSLLEWVAASGELLDRDEEVRDDRLYEHIEAQENPISGVVVDSSGNILYQKHLSGDSANEIDVSTIEAILSQPKDEFRYKRFLYITEPLNNGESLIVLIDTSYHENVSFRVAYSILIVLIGVALLFLITARLSRCVTEPARKALEREKQFVSDASHELKTPLGAISVNAQALDMDEKNIVYVKNIISETMRMNRLIERLLTLSKIEEEGAVNKHPISLSEISEEVILTYESVAFDKKINLQYEMQKSVMIRGDEDEIRQLVVILLDNAIKNAGEGGYIDIALSAEHGDILLSVRNSGAVINAQDMEHIFERFYTTDKSRHGDSFGLGLSIAKAITDNHGGTISASSSPEEGTTFRVHFEHQ